MSLHHTESDSSIASKTPSVKWKDPVLSPTFHDVHIEQVQIVDPNSGTVSFHESLSEKRQSSGDRSSAGLKMVAPPPSEEGSMGTNISDEFRGDFRNIVSNSEKFQTPKSQEKRKVDSTVTVKWADGDHAHNAPFVSLPLEPLGSRLSKDRSVHAREKLRSSHAEERRRQKIALIRHVQRLQSNESPQHRRLLSGNSVGKQQQQRYYEVAPGIVLTELPPNEIPHTAPESGLDYYDQRMIEYVDRAKTVPHITKSIIWTAKHCVANRRAVSSNSSTKWQEITDIDMHKKANIFVKMPFKQTPCVTLNTEKTEVVDEVVLPSDELRITTAYTVSRVRRGLKRMQTPNISDSKAGRLLKGKLQPLRPVQLYGPRINTCQGIQPEYHQKRSYSPTPSRQRHLKDHLNMFYENHRIQREEYERKMIRAQSATSRESVHRTSPEPQNMQDLSEESVILNEQTGLYLPGLNGGDNTVGFDGDRKAMALSNQLESVHLESGVIF